MILVKDDRDWTDCWCHRLQCQRTVTWHVEVSQCRRVQGIRANPAVVQSSWLQLGAHEVFRLGEDWPNWLVKPAASPIYSRIVNLKPWQPLENLGCPIPVPNRCLLRLVVRYWEPSIDSQLLQGALRFHADRRGMAWANVAMTDFWGMLSRLLVQGVLHRNQVLLILLHTSWTNWGSEQTADPKTGYACEGSRWFRSWAIGGHQSLVCTHFFHPWLA